MRFIVLVRWFTEDFTENDTGIFLLVSLARFLDTSVNRKLTQNFQPNLVGIESKGKRLKEQNQVISWIKFPADYSTVIKNWQRCEPFLHLVGSSLQLIFNH
jgi:hypothetical protein